MTAVELLVEQVFGKNTNYYVQWKLEIEQALEMEKEQRQEDTNYGYSEGYDDGAKGKEPMRPGLLNFKSE